MILVEGAESYRGAGVEPQSLLHHGPQPGQVADIVPGRCPGNRVQLFSQPGGNVTILVNTCTVLSDELMLILSSDHFQYNQTYPYHLLMWEW